MLTRIAASPHDLAAIDAYRQREHASHEVTAAG
jgi:hypothetical protein